MAKSFLLDPEQVRQRLLGRYRKQCRQWLTGSGEWPLRLSLGVPTERQAAAQLSQVHAWQTAWLNWNGAGRVVWGERRWSALGAQRLPEALLIDSAEALATLIGKGDEWARACSRFDDITAQWPMLAEVLPRHFNVLADWAAVEYQRLIEVVRWLASHPSSGIYIRQLPVPGVDSKWLESRQSVLCGWLQHIQGVEANGDLYELTGLRRLPLLLRFRLLDPVLRARMGGLGDIHAPVSELVSLQLPIARVFIVENLQTGLAFEDMPGAVVFMKQGYAVDVFGELPWLKRLPCYYWGDLDGHGFAILNRLRHHLPEVRSLLMDSETLLRHRELWGHEEKPVNAELEYLVSAEKELFDALRQNRWGVGVRLEQERVDWNYAAEKIQSVV